MTTHLTDARDQLYPLLQALEQSLLDQVREFERQTGMTVRAVKLYPGDWHNGRPITRALEVAAQLR